MRGSFIFSVVFLLSFSLAYSIYYSENQGIFEANIIEISHDENYQYTIKVRIDNLENGNFEYNAELLYLAENLVLSEKTFDCKVYCIIDLPVERTFFGTYKLSLFTKKGKRNYAKEIVFDLDMVNNLYDVNINPIVYLDPLNGIFINGTINGKGKEFVKYTFEVFPQSAPESISVFSKECKGNCDFSFNINSEIVIDKYFVNIYSIGGDLQKNFILKLPYNNNISQDSRKEKFEKYFNTSKNKEISKYFFYNDYNKSGVDIKTQFYDSKTLSFKNNSEIKFGEIVNVDFTILNSSVKSIYVQNLNISNSSIGFENIFIESIGEISEISNAFAIDPKFNSEVTSYELTFVAVSDILYKCKDYNFLNKDCYGSFEKVMDTVPGVEYRINLTPEDPLFVEVPKKTYRVQNGLITGSATSFTDSISSVNTSQSFVLMRTKSSDSTPDDWQVTPYFSSSTQVGFDRYSSASAVDVSWQVVESNQFMVQNGVWSMPLNIATADINISYVNTNESFVIVYGRCADSTTSDSQAGFFFGNLTNSTRVHLERGNEGKCAATVRWQVVQWDGAKVQKGGTYFDSVSTAVPSNLVSSVNLSNVLLIFGYSAIGNDPGMDTNLIRGTFSTDSALIFNRYGAVGNAERQIVWYVIEHDDISTNYYSQTFSSSTTQAVNAVTNLSRSFWFSSSQNSGGGQTYSNSFFTMNLSSSTLMSFTKQTGSNTNIVDYFVAEFQPINTFNKDGEVILNASSDFNLSSDDLFCNYELSSSVSNVFVNWMKDNSYIMVLGMPFEGNSSNSLIDYSNNSNIGVNVGASGISNLGLNNSGGYIFTDSGDYIEVSPDSSLDLTGPFTISAWINASSLGPVDYQTIINKEDSSGASNDRNFWLSLWGAAPVGSAHFRFSTSSSSTDCDVGGSSDLRDDKWHHLTGVYNGTHCMLYVDGVIASTYDSVIGVPEGQGDSLRIGGEVGVAGRGFLGVIDEVRIYNRSLSSVQINNLFNQTDEVMSSFETKGLEQWQCSVTTFDSIKEGLTYFSNTLEVIATSIPQIINVVLETSSTSNYTIDNLTCNYLQVGSATSSAVTWFVDSSPFMGLYLPFEGNSSNALLDFSDSGNDGSYSLVSWSVSNGYNNTGGMTFSENSGQFIDVGNDSSLRYDGNSDFTLSFWMKSIQSSGDPPIVSDKDWGNGWNNGYVAHLEDGVCKINIGDGLNRVDLDGTIIVNDGNWHMCTFVFEETSDVTLYVDGVYDGSADITSINDVQSSLSTVIGNDGTKSYSAIYNGSIDEVRIFQRALSEEQIVNFYENKTNQISWTETLSDEIWECSVTPFDVESAGESILSNFIQILQMPPELNLSLVQPLSSEINVYKGAQYDIVFNVSCIGMDSCNNINLNLNYLAKDIIGESGSVFLANNENKTIAFSNSYNHTPVVIAVAASDVDSDNNGLLPVFHIINESHFTISLCEDAGISTCSAVVEEEEVHYYVFDVDVASDYSWLDVGYVSNVLTDGGDNAITFSKTFSNIPYVFAWSQTDNDGGNAIAPTGWLHTITTTGAQLIGCDQPDGSDVCSGSTTETYGYVAIDVANAQINGLSYGSEAIAASTWTSVSFTETYNAARVLVAQNSDSGSQDPEYPWAQLVTDIGAQVRYCEQDGIGVCDSHNAETIVWLALEDGRIETNFMASTVISNVSDTYPLYLTSSNPKTINLISGAYSQISFPLFFNGAAGSIYEIFASVDYGNDSSHFNATLLDSSINISLISPYSLAVVQNDSFLISTNISCVGYCGEIIASSRYNQTVISNVTNAVPFYTQGLATQTCNPGIDGSCILNWTTFTTGNLSEMFLIDVLVNSSVFGVNDTSDNLVQIISGPEIKFNQSFLNITDAVANYKEGESIISILAFLTNQTNVDIVCESGDCSIFSSNFSIGSQVDVGTPSSIKFYCLPTKEGTFSALFSVVSSEDTSLDYLNITCVGTELPLYVNLEDPNTDFQYDILQNNTFNVSLNITCSNVGGCNNTELGLYFIRDSIGETGSVYLSNFESKEILFEREYANVPVVIAVAASDVDSDDNGLLPVIDSITSTGFTISLCEDAGISTCSAVVEEEEVHYYVFDVDVASDYSWLDVGYVSNVLTDGGDNAITFSKTFSNIPYVFAWSQTDNDGGNAIAPTGWLHTITTTGAQLIGCDQPDGSDVCSGSTTETYGYVAIDVANAQIGELSYGSESISNSLWTSVGFSQSYSSSRVLVAQNSDAGAQDPQYPWAKSVTTTGAQVRYCEQDGIGVCDGHAAETIVWLALEDGPIYINNLSSSLVSTVSLTKPFYTFNSNPSVVNISENSSKIVNFLLNATGDIDKMTYLYGLLDNGIDSKVLTTRIVGFNELLFGDINLTFSKVYQDENVGLISTTLWARYANSNVNVSCISGDCSTFTSSWTNGNGLTEGQNVTLTFICSDVSVGNFNAIFAVDSNDADITNTINLSCEVDYKTLDIDLHLPSSNKTKEVIMNTSFELIFNVSCVNISGCLNVPVFSVYEDRNKNWWNRSWPYKQNMSLNSQVVTTSNYTFLIVLNSTNIGSQFNWILQCQDLRFARGDVELGYWIEYCNYVSQDARIWVRTDSPLNIGTVYNFSMYYGNEDVSSVSDGNKTFFFFEDFESYDSISDGVIPPSWTIYSSGSVLLDTVSSNRVLLKTGNDDPNGGYIDFSSSITNYEAFLENK